MTTAHQLPELGSHLFRPTIVEARLMTAKQAQDAVYVATLAEELRGIERKLHAREDALKSAGGSEHESIAAQPTEEECDAEWIRTKCRELDSRLRRIEKIERSRVTARVPRARVRP